VPSNLIRIIYLVLLVTSIQTHSALSKQDFYRTLGLGKALFQPLAEAHFEELEIYAAYDSQLDNAFARREGKEVSLTFFGGMRLRVGMNRDVLALIFCHELGHLYGEDPYSNRELRKSVEGQADYWAILSGCFETMLENMPDPNDWTAQDPRQNIADLCRGTLRNCERVHRAMIRLARSVRRERGEAAPDLMLRDNSQVEETLRTHPSAQCRLDTFRAGFQKLPRPSCWFKETFDLDFLYP